MCFLNYKIFCEIEFSDKIGIDKNLDFFEVKASNFYKILIGFIFI